METIDTLSKRINDVEITLVEMKGQLKEIYEAIVGNAKLDQQGLISRIKKLEEESESNKSFKNKLLGMSAIGGGSVAIVFELLKIFVLK